MGRMEGERRDWPWRSVTHRTHVPTGEPATSSGSSVLLMLLISMESSLNLSCQKGHVATILELDKAGNSRGLEAKVSSFSHCSMASFACMVGFGHSYPGTYMTHRAQTGHS